MSALSLLPLFEPMLGICFALNLAYVGLNRFRHRSKIERHAKSKLETLKGSDSFKETNWYRGLVRLARLTDRAKDGQNGDLRWEPWCIFYRLWFEKNLDFHLSFFFAFFSALLVAVGVSHSSGRSHYLGWLFADQHFAVWWWIIFLMSALPVVWVGFGMSMVSGAKDWIDSHVEDMEKSLQREAREPVLAGKEKAEETPPK